MDELVDKTLIEYFTGKKFFFPVFVKSIGRDKLFKPGKRCLDMKLFLTEEDTIKWCSEENIAPINLVQYDLLCTPKRVITTQELTRLTKQMSIKKESSKKVTKATAQAVKNVTKVNAQPVKKVTKATAQAVKNVTKVNAQPVKKVTKAIAQAVVKQTLATSTKVASVKSSVTKNASSSNKTVPPWERARKPQQVMIAVKKATTTSSSPRVRRTKAEIAAGISLQVKIANKKNS